MRRDLSAVRALGLDDDIALRFASLRSTLRRQGQIIGDHDIWIAATALQHDLTLITRDSGFQRISGLKIDAMN
jgi:tRNA(fMet)-specific endonuclease VapC